MAFLLSRLIIIYAILNPILGKYIDYVYNSTGTVRPALLNTAAIQLERLLFACFSINICCLKVRGIGIQF